jgi:hypothetical protein
METTFLLIYFDVLNLFQEGNVFCILKFLMQIDSREIFFNLAIIPMEYSRPQYSMESSKLKKKLENSCLSNAT